MVTELMLAALELRAERNEEERDSSRCSLAERWREGGKERLEAMGIRQNIRWAEWIKAQKPILHFSFSFMSLILQIYNGSKHKGSSFVTTHT
jgi:hypothetical protein